MRLSSFVRLFSVVLCCSCVLLLFALPAQSQEVCDTFYAPGYALSPGTRAPAMTPLSRPPRGLRVSEPEYSTCLVRATDHVADGTGKFSRAYYARRQAFNADNTYFFTLGEGWHNLYDAKTLQHIRRLSPRAVDSSISKEFHINSDSDAQWDATDPNALYYLPSTGGTKLMKLDVRDNSFQVVADFKAHLPAWAATAKRVWSRWEGSPSADSRYWGFQVEDGYGQVLGYMVWDLVDQRLVGSMESVAQADHTSMSPSGRWIVIADTETGTGTWAYSPDFTQKKRLMATSTHSDLAIGANGHDHYVGVDYASSKGDVFMVDLDACPAVAASAETVPYCPRTVLFQLYSNGSSSALHISGKAYERPGWVVLSTYSHKNSRDGSVPWYANKVFVVEMAANPRIYPLSYTRRTSASSGDPYWSEPHATVNRDLTRIAFNSNWGGSSYEDIDTYMIALPATALPGGPVVAPPTRVTGGRQRPRIQETPSAALPAPSESRVLPSSSAPDHPSTVVRWWRQLRLWLGMEERNPVPPDHMRLRSGGVSSPTCSLPKISSSASLRSAAATTPGTLSSSSSTEVMRPFSMVALNSSQPSPQPFCLRGP